MRLSRLVGARGRSGKATRQQGNGGTFAWGRSVLGMAEPDKPILSEYWYRVFPELRHFKTRGELRELKRVFRRQPSMRRRGWLMVVAIGVAGGVLSWVLIRILLSCGLSVWLAGLITVLASIVLGVVASFYGWQRPYIRFVRQYLQDHGVAVCLGCGYDLRGQTVARCPECSLAFDPALLDAPDPSSEPARVESCDTA